MRRQIDQNREVQVAAQAKAADELRGLRDERQRMRQELELSAEQQREMQEQLVLAQRARQESDARLRDMRDATPRGETHAQLHAANDAASEARAEAASLKVQVEQPAEK